ncbi:AAA domain-containing protein [Sphingobacterium bovistauri]|uniref:AAA family ATPase n=1 Tax=Sphingobacterium bovistauri TaxID=2781959 RepID=A0ABS7Z3V8_9SPHI|nr:AAA domain-containing protein [Sphingobacterium bovistauri]MCA5004843.1 AAA family ATPase [Sphingobacterium bovistauri]
MKYFDDLLALLKQEQDYDRKLHEELLFKSNLNMRKEQGMTWFPIAITQSEMGRGDYLSITVNKTNNVAEGHRFRFGMPVSLFSNHDPEEDRINGVISFVSRDTMRISLRVDELPDWSRRGKLGVDLLFDENSYREMEQVLHLAKDLVNDEKEGGFIRQLIGKEDIYVHPASQVYHNVALNESQNQAITNMLSQDRLTILHGPPGTGKTTTLIHGVKALVKERKKQILVVAPSNTAIDLLTERLDAIGVHVVRMGNPVRVSDHLLNLTLDAKMNNHTANKEVKNLDKQARAYQDMAHKYKRSFGRAEREQRKALFDEAKKIRKEIDKIQDYVMEDVLDKAEVITATLVGSNHFSIRNRKYEIVIIDEAAQALEPACWLPILKGEKVILAGDHLQLPPTVKSSKDSSKGLYVTLFEKLLVVYPQFVSVLNVQYRMNKFIMQYPSHSLYNDGLIASEKVAQWTINNDTKPILFIDTAGAGYDENIEDDAISNVEEAHFLLNHLQESIQSFEQISNGGILPSIGVITPYRKQSILLKELIGADEMIANYGGKVQVHTIDSFQGQEKDLIYISLVRSNSQQNIGFLADIRRMNVAMTRARKKLIVIGDSSTIGQHPFYKGFIDYVSDLDTYHSVWEWND